MADDQPDLMSGFTDPPGVAGDGQPSGGAYSASGVMTFFPSQTDGSYLDTCVLPPSEVAACTASLNSFIRWYGSM